MSVNQLSFFALFFLSVILYYCVPRKCQWMALLGISLLFYHLMGVDNFIYVLVTAGTLTWTTGKMYQIDCCLEEELKNAPAKLTRSEKKEKKAQAKSRKKRWLLCMIFINLGILLVLKYGDFFVHNANRILGVFGIDGMNKLGLVVPLGLSYYTLQAIGYALDVYKGKSVPEKNPCKVLLFVTFFPQMTQGPIGRFGELAPQLYVGRTFSYKNLSYGCQRILWGMMKKTVIADNLRPLATGIFHQYKTVDGFTLFMACIYTTFQIYADFSGYSDIVCGIGEIYGIRMEENFTQPFFSKSLSEYWRRWHISLSSWFRDYIFYPASISKSAVSFGKFGGRFLPPRISKMFPAVFALSLVWISTGLWHDASWRYILWGAANGAIIISAIILKPQFDAAKAKLHIREDGGLWQVFCMIRTFLIVSLLKVFPGAGSTIGSLRIFKKIFFDFHPALDYTLWFMDMESYRLIYAAIGLVLFLIVSILQTKGKVRDFLAAKPVVVRWAVYLFLLSLIMFMGAFDSTAIGGFEYAQF